jgi:hypothetical protein
MYLAAGNTERGVVATNSFGVGGFEQAEDFAVRIVEQLNLTDAEFVGLVVLRLLRYLLNGIVRQLQIFVVIHELWHVTSSFDSDALTKR